jgi:DNA-binding beta-propeller fold protein YncE
LRVEQLEDRQLLSGSQTLGTNALVEGPAAGSDSDLVEFAGPWAAAANASWLHTTSSGSGNGLATINFDANSGAARTGTLTVAGATLTVTQAGSDYLPATAVTSLVSSGLRLPYGVAVDRSGNVYTADYGNSAVEEWNASTQTVSTLVSSGIDWPWSVAVDGAGNVYIADSDNAITEWNSATGAVSAPVSGFNDPHGVAVDGAGNVYIADSFNNAVDEWNASTQTLSTLVSSGLSLPYGLAVDSAGNVYIADLGDSAIKEWNASTQSLSTLVSSGLGGPYGVAVDGSGNVYIADYADNAIKEWNASTQTVSTLVSSGLSAPAGVAVDSSGNVFIADTEHNAIKELPRAYVPGGVISEGAAAGTDVLLPVLPATAPLTGVLAPSSDQSWLTVGSVAGGVVHFSFTANTGPARAAHITLLGEQIAVTQAGVLADAALFEGAAAGSDSDTVNIAGGWTATANAPWLHTSSSGSGPGAATFSFDANSGAARTGTLTIAGETLTVIQAAVPNIRALVEGPAAGSDSYVVTFADNWTATANASWLHVAAGGAAGTRNALVQFSFDANTGATRTGILTIAGQTLTVTQAGSSCVAANSVALPGLVGMAVDGSGNVYIADGNTIEEWNAATETLTTLVSSGLNDPEGVAVDGSGNVYIADGNTIKEWHAATQTVSTLVSSGLCDPIALAVDGSGNAYIADPGDNAVKEWNAATKTLTTLLSSGLNDPASVAVDGAGNVYIADNGDNAIKEWIAATQTVSTLITTRGAYGLAADHSGNLYYIIYINNSGGGGGGGVKSGNNNSGYAIIEWNAATQTSKTLVSRESSYLDGLAVDGSGDVYFADTADNSIGEWNAATQRTSTPIVFGLSSPFSMAVDLSGNVYFVDTQANELKDWNAATQTVSTLVSSGLSGPAGVAVDAAGNVYFGDAGNNAIKEWNAATQTVSTLVSSGLNDPMVVAVDAAGNVYIGEIGDSTIMEWHAATQSLNTLSSWDYPNEEGIAVDASGDIYVANSSNDMIAETSRAYVSNAPINEGAAAGSDALAVVPPAGESLTGILASRSSTSWLILGSVSAGALNFSFTENTGAARTAYITVLGQQIAVTQAAILAATTQAESAAAGSGSDVVSYAGPWTATANAAWLHTTSRGNGDGLATFTFDANTGPTRTGTLTIAGQTLTVTQSAALGATVLLEGAVAGNDSDVVNYAGPWTATASASWLHTSAAGNGNGLATFTFDANPGPTRSGVLTIAGETLTVTQAGNGYVAASALTTLIPSPLLKPEGVAVDSAGNVYIADTGDNAIKEWNPATHALSILVSSGLSGPTGVAVDALGNVYIAEAGNNAIKEWNAGTKTVTTLVSSGLNNPEGLALDAAGNVYIADTGNSTIDEWNAQTQTVSSLVSSGLHGPVDVAVDTAGNVYIADVNDNVIREWNAATQTLGTLVTVTSVNNQYSLAVDASGNVYIDDTYDGAIMVWNATTHNVSTLVSAGFIGPQEMAVDGAGNVYIAETGYNALQVWSPSTQTLNTLIAPAAGIPSSLAVSSAGNLYIPGISASGTAVNEWTAATQTISTLFSAALGFNNPRDIAVDTSGNVYVSDSVDNALEEWNASTQTVSALGPSGLSEPSSVAVDGVGNVYFVEGKESIVAEWNLAAQTLGTLVSSGLGDPQGIAVDASGNVYIPDTSDDTINEWNAATQTVGTLVSSGVGSPRGVAVDGSGNVYIADSGDKAIKQWNAATETLNTLVSSGLASPSEVAVDAAGNVYILDTGDDAIEELPRAFIPGGPINEGAAAGSDALAAIVPASVSLTGVFAPSSNASWLTIGSVSGGVVNFSFTQNTDAARSAYITVLGQQIAVTQAGRPVVTGVSPASGPTIGGTIVTITGTSFTAATLVDFGTTAASSVVINSAGTQITATSPAESAGTVNVTVIGPGGTSAVSAADQFTYTTSAAVTGVGEEIVDNSQPGFWSSSSSTWTITSNGLGGTSLVSAAPNGVRIAGSPPGAPVYPSQAAWWFSMPAGVYEIAITYTAGSNLTKDMGLDLYDGVGNWIGQIPVNEQVAPHSFSEDGVAWENLGAFRLMSNVFHISTWNSSTDGAICVNGIQLQSVPVIDDANVLDSYTYYPPATSVGSFTTTGSWTTSAQGAFSGSHVSSGALGSGSSTVTWTMPVAPGSYEVDVTWPASASLSASATYNVYDGGSKLGSVIVDQQTAPSGIGYEGLNWQSLGSFTVSSAALSVTLADSASDGQIDADAVLILPAYQPTPIVANGYYPGFWSSNSGWATQNTGLYGTSLVSDTPNGVPIAGSPPDAPAYPSQAAWWFPVQPGNYEVYVTWVPGSNLSATTPFDVYNALSYISEPVVNEQDAPVGVTDQGVVWQSLGTFTMTSDVLHVSTWNSQTNGAMNVSGVRIVPVST